MDTSIIVVIAIVVVFAVAVPAMIRKSATELSRVEIDSVPDNAAVVSAETPIPGHDHSERTQVFRDKPRKVPSVPVPDVSLVETAPKLSLSSTPEFSVIEGQAGEATIAEAADQSQIDVVPIAVGETHSAFAAEHEASGQSGAGNVRMLHPAVHAVFNDSARGTGSPSGSDGGRGRPAQSHPPHAQSPAAGQSAAAGSRSTIGQAPRGGAPWTGGSGTGGGGRLGDGAPNTSDPQNFHPHVGDDEEQAMTEQATSLRESLKSLGTMVRGFALVFLGSVLGILVTSVLALFSVVHIALAGVFVGLAVVSLLLVRTLNLRKAAVKKRLRRLERTPKRSAEPRTASARSQAAPTRSRAATSDGTPAARAQAQTAPAKERTIPVKEQQSGASDSAPAPARTAGQPAPASTTARTRTAERPAPAPTSSGTAARIAAAAQAKNGSTKAAQARAAMAHSTEAKKAREEADTGEIPLVRVRKEAGEGHTTRQVLLTGPIPVVEEDAPAEATVDSADRADESASRSAEDDSSGAPKDADATRTAKDADDGRTAKDATGGSVSLGSDLVADAPAAQSDRNEADADVHAALEASAPQVDDPFMQRLKSRNGWSPTPLPVPSYVDAPEAEHSVPSASAADASSYETEARSREDIAAQFAAELGYRPELSDSAREEGPLGHGRKAIRTTKAADLGAVNDVLARRRA